MIPKLKVSLLSDTRQKFDTPGNTGSDILNSYEVEEALIIDRWNSPSTVTVKFYCKTQDAKDWLVPGNNPGNKFDESFVRARWVAMQDARRKFKFFLISESKIKQINSLIAEVEAVCTDAREWLETHPTFFAADQSQVLVRVRDVTKSYFLTKMTGYITRDSNFAPVPIMKINTSSLPSGGASIGGVLPSEAEDGDLSTYLYKFPLSLVDHEFYAFLDEWGYELYPQAISAALGVTTPWLEWMLRKKVDRTRDWLFSEFSGTLEIEGITVNNKLTETLSYNSNRNSNAALGGSNHELYSYIQQKPGLKNQWLGLQFKEETIDIELEKRESDGQYVEGNAKDIADVLIKSARWSNKEIKRLTFSGKVIFDESKVGNPVPGMKISARVLDRVFKIELQEVASHYLKDKGWSRTSPIEYKGNVFSFPGEDDDDDGGKKWPTGDDNDPIGSVYKYALAPLVVDAALNNIALGTTTYIPYNSPISTFANVLYMYNPSTSGGPWLYKVSLVKTNATLKPGAVIKDIGTISVSTGANAISVPKFIVPDEYFMVKLEQITGGGRLYGSGIMPHVSQVPLDPKVTTFTQTPYYSTPDIANLTMVPYISLGKI